MLKQIEEFEKHVLIAGFEKVKIRDFQEFFERIHREKPSDVEIQFFDAKLVATWQHLYFAALNALTAFKNRENFSKTLAMESMLYASAQRQIRKATILMGIKPSSSEIAVLIITAKPESGKSALSLASESFDGRRDDTTLELSEEKTAAIREAFRISDVELQSIADRDDFAEALTAIVTERMALLATQR